MTRVVIFGNGSAASFAHAYLLYDSPHEVVAFTVDRAFIREQTMLGLPVVPFDEIESLYPPSSYEMFVMVGFVQVNRLRAERYRDVKAKGYKLISHVCSNSATWPDLAVGENTLVMEGCAIQPFVTIGNNCLISPGVVMAHHTVVEDHCYLAPSAALSGNVTVGQYSFLGTNCTIRDGIRIAPRCVVGAGTVVIADTVEQGVYVGNPARLLPKRSDELGL